MPLNKLEYQLIDMFEAVKASMKLGPLVLGGPPGGYRGYLPQTRVAYDPIEDETLATTLSGTLLDNLNHIRYRIGALEGGGSPGSISVQEDDILIASGVTILNFEGGVSVTDDGGGKVTILVSGGAGIPGGSDTYVQYNASGVLEGNNGFRYDYIDHNLIIGPYIIPSSVLGTNTFHNIGVDFSPANFLWAFGDTEAGFLTGVVGEGTDIDPSGVHDGRVILRKRGRGYYDSGGFGAFLSNTQVEHRFVTVGDWTNVSRGTKQEFYITPSGSTTMESVPAATLDENGISVASDKTYSIDGSPINYTHISDNDVDTDVTGAELETLSDGSNADDLHEHTMDGISDLPILSTGTYAPTLTNVQNFTSVTIPPSNDFNYMRLGNMCMVSGQITAQHDGSGQGRIGISLPFASDIATQSDCPGNATIAAGMGSGSIVGDGTNNRAEFRVDQSIGTTEYTWTFVFMYIIK